MLCLSLSPTRGSGPTLAFPPQVRLVKRILELGAGASADRDTDAGSSYLVSSLSLPLTTTIKVETRRAALSDVQATGTSQITRYEGPPLPELAIKRGVACPAVVARGWSSCLTLPRTGLNVTVPLMITEILECRSCRERLQLRARNCNRFAESRGVLASNLDGSCCGVPTWKKSYLNKIHRCTPGFEGAEHLCCTVCTNHR